MLKLAKIKQLFADGGFGCARDEFLSVLDGGEFGRQIAGRKRIAIAVGSRGIANIAVFVSELAGWLKGAGFEPFIVPAMGSHGYADAAGQEMVLDKLGISRESVGVDIVSSMEVVAAGEVELDGRQYPVYVDKAAWGADGVILINRVKQHSDFISNYESGLVKMATVGLGNHKGALQIHSLGIKGLKELMPLSAKVLFEQDKIIGGFAIVEDGYHRTAAVRWVGGKDILADEPGILEEAKGLMPRFPVDDIDLLIIKQMGKDISGVGIDTKVIGRLMIWGEDDPVLPRIELIGVCGLTKASYGNALGIGLSDFITKELFDDIDWGALKENILTATFYQRGKTPLVLDDERQIIEVACRHFERRGKENPKVVVIRDTLNLSDLYVSKAVLDEIKGADNIEVVRGLGDIVFDDKGRIVADF